MTRQKSLAQTKIHQESFEKPTTHVLQNGVTIFCSIIQSDSIKQNWKIIIEKKTHQAGFISCVVFEEAFRLLETNLMKTSPPPPAVLHKTS